MTWTGSSTNETTGADGSLERPEGAERSTLYDRSSVKGRSHGTRTSSMVGDNRARELLGVMRAAADVLTATRNTDRVVDASDSKRFLEGDPPGRREHRGSATAGGRADPTGGSPRVGRLGSYPWPGLVDTRSGGGAGGIGGTADLRGVARRWTRWPSRRGFIQDRRRTRAGPSTGWRHLGEERGGWSAGARRRSPRCGPVADPGGEPGFARIPRAGDVLKLAMHRQTRRGRAGHGATFWPARLPLGRGSAGLWRAWAVQDARARTHPGRARRLGEQIVAAGWRSGGGGDARLALEPAVAWSRAARAHRHRALLRGSSPDSWPGNLAALRRMSIGRWMILTADGDRALRAAGAARTPRGGDSRIEPSTHRSPAAPVPRYGGSRWC